jgi:hypothetical protein
MDYDSESMLSERLQKQYPIGSLWFYRKDPTVKLVVSFAGYYDRRQEYVVKGYIVESGDVTVRTGTLVTREIREWDKDWARAEDV